MSKPAIEWVKHLPPSARKEFFQLCKEQDKKYPHTVGRPSPNLSSAITAGIIWPKDNVKYWEALYDSAALQESKPEFKGAYRWATILSH